MEARIPPWRRGSRSHSKGKEPTVSIEEPEEQVESPNEAGTLIFIHPKSMKDLWGTKVRKDDVGYYALYMSNLAQQDPDKEMRARWENLRNSSKMALFDRVHDVGRLITCMDYWINNLLQEINALKAVAATEEWVTELERELARTQQEQTEALQRLEASDKELNEVQDDYKGSVGFKEGLKRMGRVAYEYSYRVVLVRFRSSHPDSEVEDNPFTIRPEDDSVAMERQ
ncbi:hypothetical protein GW17_00060138 [Ensete ventricosum]|nr:hypothetical protein GW17_00060138 [Ensete ventricosum]